LRTVRTCRTAGGSSKVTIGRRGVLQAIERLQCAKESQYFAGRTKNART